NARLDDYVRAGIGDPADALRDLSQFRNVKGDEFAGLVLWMRAWNLAHPDDMVRIAGFDAQDSGRDADIALTYLAARDAAVAGLSIFEHGLDPPEGMNRAEYYGRRDRAMARIALRMQQRTERLSLAWDGARGCAGCRLSQHRFQLYRRDRADHPGANGPTAGTGPGQ
ncbi:MAG: hypothetical protein DI636_10465, partial [Pelagerythrobacter marensis]